MSIIPVACLSSSDLVELGNNVLPAVERDHRQVAAVNRSLAVHDEIIGRLYRRPTRISGARRGGRKAVVAHA